MYHLIINYPGFLYFLGFLFILIISFWYYKKESWLSYLFFLRIILLTLIMTLLFDPKIVFNFKNKIKKYNLYFFDNSSSIKFLNNFDSVQYIKLINKIDSLDDRAIIYKFGSKIVKGKSMDWRDSVSSIRDINGVYNADSIASITLVTDGNLVGIDNFIKTIDPKINYYFVAPFKNSQKSFDYFINDIVYYNKNMQSSDINYQVKIGYKGTIKNQKIILSVLNNSDSVFYKHEIELPDSGKYLEHSFNIPNILKNGMNILTFNLSGKEKDDNPLNNTRKIYQMSSFPDKVLFLNPHPSYDFHFLKQSLLDLGFSCDIRYDSTLTKKEIKEYSTVVLCSSDKIPFALEDFSSVIVLHQAFDAFSEKKFIYNHKNKIKGSISLPKNISLQSEFLYKSSEINFFNFDDLPRISISAYKLTINDSHSYNIYADFRGEDGRLYPAIFEDSRFSGKCIYLNLIDFWKYLFIPDYRGNRATSFSNLLNNLFIYLKSSNKNAFLDINTDKKRYYNKDQVMLEGRYYDKNGNILLNKDLFLYINNKFAGKFLFNNSKYQFMADNFNPGIYHYEIKLDSNSLLKEGYFSVDSIKFEEMYQSLNMESFSALLTSVEGQFFFNIDSLLSKRPPTDIENIKTKTIKLTHNIYYFILIIILFSLELFLRKKHKLL